MTHQGHCYCGAVRYEITQAPVFNAQCHCRECQYISGGSANVCLGIPESGFRYTAGKPKSFRRADLANPVARDFCPECGTHLTARAPGAAGLVIVKRGTLDNPAAFGNPQLAIFTCDAQPFHHIAHDLQSFERLPQR
jgi:hypothetical protein